MEYIDILDQNGIPTGEIKDKDDAYKLGLWHWEVHVWIVNDKDEFLMQRRSPNKKFNPNKWAICAGHVQAGETTLKAAKRELAEEVGIELSEDEFKYLFRYKNNNVENNVILINNCFADVYVVKINNDISEFKIQEDEVSEIKYVDCEMVRKIKMSREKSEEIGLYDDVKYFDMLFSKLGKNIPMYS